MKYIQIILNRNGKHFGSILNFLRDGQIPLPDTRRELLELQAEAKYFCMEELSSACDTSLSKMGWGEVMSRVHHQCNVTLLSELSCNFNPHLTIIWSWFGVWVKHKWRDDLKLDNTDLWLVTWPPYWHLMCYREAGAGTLFPSAECLWARTSHKEEQALINANNMKPVHIGNFLKGKSLFSW